MKKKLAAAKDEDREATLAVNKAQDKFYKGELPEAIKKLKEFNQLVVIFIESMVKDFYSLVVQQVPLAQQTMSDISVMAAKSDYRHSMAQLAKLEADEGFRPPPSLALVEDLERSGGAGVQELSRQSMDFGSSSIRATDIEAIHAGWLNRQDNVSKAWKKRWCVVGSDFSMYIFKSQDGDISGKFDLAK